MSGLPSASVTSECLQKKEKFLGKHGDDLTFRWSNRITNPIRARPSQINCAAPVEASQYFKHRRREASVTHVNRIAVF
jgi:hypothetical protein